MAGGSDLRSGECMSLSSLISGSGLILLDDRSGISRFNQGLLEYGNRCEPCSDEASDRFP